MASKQINLTDYCTDIEGQAITFSVVSSTGGAVFTISPAGVLTISSQAVTSGVVVIKATDEANKSAIKSVPYNVFSEVIGNNPPTWLSVNTLVLSNQDNEFELIDFINDEDKPNCTFQALSQPSSNSFNLSPNGFLSLERDNTGQEITGSFTVRVLDPHGAYADKTIHYIEPLFNVDITGITFNHLYDPSYSVPIGTSLEFEVEVFIAGAANGRVVSYQWYKNNLAIGGALSSTLAMPSPVTSDAGTYHCVATVSKTGLTSYVHSFTTFNLSVSSTCTTPVITVQPSAGIVNQNANYTLNITATPATSYQWKKNNVDIAGATGSSHTITNAQPSDGGMYSCVVVNSCGGGSSPAYVTSNVVGVSVSSIVVLQDVNYVTPTGATGTPYLTPGPGVRTYDLYINAIVNWTTSTIVVIPDNVEIQVRYIDWQGNLTNWHILTNVAYSNATISGTSFAQLYDRNTPNFPTTIDIKMVAKKAGYNDKEVIFTGVPLTITII